MDRISASVLEGLQYRNVSNFESVASVLLTQNWVPEVTLNPSNHILNTGARTVHFHVILPSRSGSSWLSIFMRFTVEMYCSSFVNIYRYLHLPCLYSENNFDHVMYFHTALPTLPTFTPPQNPLINFS